MTLRKLSGVLTFAVIVAFPLASARGATIMVEQTIDSVGPADENCSLRNAIIATNLNADFGGCAAATGDAYNLATPDTIVLPAGTYQLTRCPDLAPDPNSGDLDIMGALTIQGAGTQLSIIDASPLSAARGIDCRDRVFHVHIQEAPDPNTFSPAVELQDLMIVGGNTSDDGGGLLSVNGSDSDTGASINPVVTLLRVQVGVPSGRGSFVANSADVRGGGVAPNTRFFLTDSTIVGNHAGLSGGGIGTGSSTTVTMDGSTVVDNTVTTGDGGGISISTGSVVMSNSHVDSNNALTRGGGIITFEGGVTLTNHSTVDGNLLGVRGGVSGAGIDASIVSVTDSSVSNNNANAGVGGGINSGEVTLVRSTVDGNKSEGQGAGLNIAGTLQITDSTISNNIGQEVGGGIHLTPGADPSSIENSTISGNSALNGGGVWFVGANGGELLIVHTTIAQNHATQEGFSGAGLFNDSFVNVLSGPVVVQSSIQLRNSIVADSVGTACGGSGQQIKDVHSLGHNIVDDSTCQLDGIGDHENEPAGLLGLLNNGGPTLTHALDPSSIARDDVPLANCTGVSGSPLATDQRGVTRPIEGDGVGPALCDTGSFEASMLATPTPTATHTPTITATPPATASPTPTTTATATIPALAATPPGSRSPYWLATGLLLAAMLALPRRRPRTKTRT